MTNLFYLHICREREMCVCVFICINLGRGLQLLAIRRFRLVFALHHATAQRHWPRDSAESRASESSGAPGEPSTGELEIDGFIEDIQLVVISMDSHF